MITHKADSKRSNYLTYTSLRRLLNKNDEHHLANKRLSIYDKPALVTAIINVCWRIR